MGNQDGGNAMTYVAVRYKRDEKGRKVNWERSQLLFWPFDNGSMSASGASGRP